MTGSACSPHRAAAVVLVALALTACSSASTPGHSNSAAASHASASARPVATRSAAASIPPAASVVLRGDAATNRTCLLASVAELEGLTGGHIVAELGLTGPGSYSKTTWSCTWYFTPSDISSPVVIVQYGVSTTPRTDVVAYYRSVIKQGYGTLIPGVGDVAKWYKHDIDLVDGRVLLTVETYLHNSTQKQATNLKVLRLVLPRAKARA